MKYLLPSLLLFPLCAMIILFVVFSPLRQVTQNNEDALHLWFLDIGQGDSILFRTAHNDYYIIDGGPDDYSLHKHLQQILPPLHKDIRGIFLSHPDKDHIQGLFQILGTYRVGFLFTSMEFSDPLYERLLSLAEQYEIPVYHAAHDSDLRLDQYTYIDFLTKQTVLQDMPNKNNQSLVFSLIHGSHRLLFTGDAEEKLEASLISTSQKLHSGILKGGHHGSKTSTSEAFLQEVQPSEVIFQNGLKNSFGHPHKEVLDRLRDHDIHFFNTSISGTVQVVCPLLKEDCSIFPEFTYETVERTY